MHANDSTTGGVVRFFGSYPTYGRLWLAMCLSMVGDVLYNVAAVWFLVSTTGSAFAASGIAIGTMIGALAGGGIAGAIVDAWHPRRVMVVTDAVRATGTAVLGLLWLAQTPSPFTLYALAAVMAFCHAFFQPARAAAVALILPREQLIRAGAVEGFGSGLVSALAWAAGGVIAATVTISNVLLIDAVTFVASLALVGLGRWAYATEHRKARRDTRPSVALQWVRHDRTRYRMLLTEGMHALVTGSVYATLPLFVLSLGGDAAMYGLQGGLFALATLAGSIVIARRLTARAGRVYAIGIAVNAFGVLLMVLAPSIGPFLVAATVAGLGVPAWAAGRQVIFQTGVPDEVRGRVFAMLDAVINTSLLPTWAAGAWLADTIGPRTLLAFAPVCYTAIIGFLLWSGIARYRTDSPQPDSEQLHPDSEQLRTDSERLRTIEVQP